MINQARTIGNERARRPTSYKTPTDTNYGLADSTDVLRIKYVMTDWQWRVYNKQFIPWVQAKTTLQPASSNSFPMRIIPGSVNTFKGEMAVHGNRKKRFFLMCNDN